MTSRRLIVYGAGGHGKVVLACARASGWEVVAAVDDAPERTTAVFCGVQILSYEEAFSRWPTAAWALGIGGNAARSAVFEKLATRGLQLPVIQHPRAEIAPDVTIGQGSVVAPGVVVNPSAVVGNGCILNSASVIEHDCVLDDFVHVSPNAAMGGGVRVGRRSQVGLGASVLPLVRIGRDVMIGAGAVVIGDVRDGVTVAGVPARELSPRV